MVKFMIFVVVGVCFIVTTFSVGLNPFAGLGGFAVLLIIGLMLQFI